VHTRRDLINKKGHNRHVLLIRDPQKAISHRRELSHTSVRPTHSPRHLSDPVTAANHTCQVNSAVNFAGFVDGHTPVPNLKRRKIAREVTQDDLARLGRERRAREAAEGLRKQEEERERCREEEQLWREASQTKLRCAMQEGKNRPHGLGIA
jgi:hypothetical protein